MGSRGVLSQRQREIIIGTLLGDACLEKNGQHTRIRIDHYNRHKEYVLWFTKELFPFALRPRVIKEVDKRNGKTYSRWHLSTKSLPIFDEFKELFYLEGKKIIPSCLEKIFTPLSLSIWYMDDGFRRKDCKGFYLCTSSYTLGEQKILQEVLRLRFGIETRIHHQRQYMRLFIPSAFAERFNSLVKPFTLPIFRYKLL